MSPSDTCGMHVRPVLHCSLGPCAGTLLPMFEQGCDTCILKDCKLNIHGCVGATTVLVTGILCL
jgi:hypothetical protein